MLNPWNALTTTPDSPDDKPLYARKGEIITYDNGHPIATFVCDVFKAEPLSGTMFDNWDNAFKAENGQKFADCVCIRCGCPWVKASSIGGSIVKIDGVWRSDHPELFHFMYEIE